MSPPAAKSLKEFEEAVAETLHDVSEVVLFLVGAFTVPWMSDL